MLKVNKVKKIIFDNLLKMIIQHNERKAEAKAKAHEEAMLNSTRSVKSKDDVQ